MKTRTFELEFNKKQNANPDKQLGLLQDLGNWTATLQSEIQLTPNNLPTAYVDPQVILEEMVSGRMIDGQLDPETKTNALIQIDYLDGIPIVNGLPFWERLDCEPLNYYRLFKTYRDTKLIETKRSFQKLEKDTNTPIHYLYALNKIYCWQPRTLAFDIYQLNLIEKERNRQIDLMEGRHKKAAERIFEICTTYLEVMEESGLLGAVSPKELQGWADLAIKLERLSLGLPGDKPKDENVNQKQSQNQNKNVINVNIEKQQIQNVANQNNKNLKMIDSEENKKFLQEVANTLLIVSPEVIEDGTNTSTIDSEPDVEARLDNSESEINSEIN